MVKPGMLARYMAIVTPDGMEWMLISFALLVSKWIFCQGSEQQQEGNPARSWRLFVLDFP
jgi:hypothetical protein